MPDKSLKSDPRAWLVAILIATALVYSRSLGNEFVYDDWQQIVNNRYLGNWSFVWKSLVNDNDWYFDPLQPSQSQFYRPLHDVWLWLTFHLFGLHPAGWHAATVALHLLVVWLVFRVASLLSANRTTGLLAAALFALMPLHAEAVVWQASVATLLGAAFELSAFKFYLSASLKAGRDADGGASGRRPRMLWLSLGLFGGALLSYESAMVFPALIAAHALYLSPVPSPFMERGVRGEVSLRVRNSLAAAWPYALELTAYLGLRLWVLGFISRPSLLNWPPLTARDVVLTIPSAIAAYAMLLAMPWRAGPAHQLDIVRSISAPGFYLPTAGLAALGALAFLPLRNHSHRRLYLFCAAWILIALAPALNLSGLLAATAIQDRYLYLPSFGFCVMVADLAVAFARASAQWAKAVWIGAAAVAIVYAAILFQLQHFWHDDVALFSRCTEEVPDAEYFHDQLGMALKARGERTGARRELRIAVALAPAPDYSLYDLGIVDDHFGDFRAAAREMAAGLRGIKYPLPRAYIILARVADAAGDPKGTEAALKQAEAIPGGAEIAALTRAQLRFRHGDSNGAEQLLRDILRRDPDTDQALITLGAVLSAGHRYDEALAIYRRAARTAANNPDLHYLIALALHHLGRDREARDECASAIAGAPHDPKMQALMDAIERGGAH